MTKDSTEQYPRESVLQDLSAGQIRAVVGNRLSPQDLQRSLDLVVSTFPPSVISRGINRNLNLYRFIVKSVAPHLQRLHSGATVCDLGAGAGIIPLVFAHRGFLVNVVDKWDEYSPDFNNQMGITEDFLRRFEQFSVHAYDCDLMLSKTPLPDGSQDLVSAYSVLEHFPRPHLLMNEIYRLLKPRGLAVILIPNVASLQSRLRHMFGATPHLDPWHNFYRSDFGGHYRELTLKELESVAKEWNLEPLTLLRSEASRINTPLSDGHWVAGWRIRPSCIQFARGLYLVVVQLFPSLRFDLLLIAQKI